MSQCLRLSAGRLPARRLPARRCEVWSQPQCLRLPALRLPARWLPAPRVDLRCCWRWGKCVASVRISVRVCYVRAWCASHVRSYVVCSCTHVRAYVLVCECATYVVLASMHSRISVLMRSSAYEHVARSGLQCVAQTAVSRVQFVCTYLRKK